MMFPYCLSAVFKIQIHVFLNDSARKVGFDFASKKVTILITKKLQNNMELLKTKLFIMMQIFPTYSL